MRGALASGHDHLSPQATSRCLTAGAIPQDGKATLGKALQNIRRLGVLWSSIVGLPGGQPRVFGVQGR
jgi:hypothetical protein